VAAAPATLAVEGVVVHVDDFVDVIEKEADELVEALAHAVESTAP
jgi:Mg/Co/Ni transporter MgtE